MPEYPSEYHCVNIGIEGYPVWLTLSDKTTIVVIEPISYAETSLGALGLVAMKTILTLVAKGCTIEAKTPASVESVCRILGFMWDEKDVVEKSAPAATPEEPKMEGEAPQ